MSTKTEQTIEALNQGKTTEEIQASVGCSPALITRCRKRIAANQPTAAPEVKEEEPTDDDIDGIIKRFQVKPEEKYLTSKDKDPEEDEYHCTGCDHKWKSASMPAICPNCGAEF